MSTSHPPLVEDKSLAGVRKEETTSLVSAKTSSSLGLIKGCVFRLGYSRRSSNPGRAILNARLLKPSTCDSKGLSKNEPK
jgi:hypothetical protein